VREMGVIKDEAISGVLPDSEGFVVHYPGYPSSITRATETLGGTEGILKARRSKSNSLELHFRPEDPHAHPAFAELGPYCSFLLKISKKKTSSTFIDSESPSKSSTAKVANLETVACNSKTASVGNTSNEAQSDETEVHTNLFADIVARVPEAYYFKGMVDYQHVLAVHAEVSRRKKRQWADVEPKFEMLTLQFNMLAFFRRFILILIQSDTTDFYFFFDPSDKNSYWFSMIRNYTTRQISSLKGLGLHDSAMKLILAIKNIKIEIKHPFSPTAHVSVKGYDPRKDPESRIYQSIDFRLPPSIRNSADANTSTEKWRDLCAFRAFPWKCQTALQLCELEDDYIQQEIKKPLEQTTCSEGAGDDFSLQSSYPIGENISKNYLQELFGGFPSSGVAGSNIQDGDISDYQILGDISDDNDNYSDGDN
ncbi:hypothetical protein MKX01_016865, partial [Papaver californicum]